MRNIKYKPSAGVKSINSTLKLKLDSEELRLFENRIIQAYAEIADSHYLSKEIKPTISVEAGKLRISIPLLAADDNEVT